MQSNPYERRTKGFRSHLNQRKESRPHRFIRSRSCFAGCWEFGPSWLVAKVAEALGTTPRSLEKLKKRFVEKGLSEAIERKQRETPPWEIKFDGVFEAKLIALACSDPLEGCNRWTVRLLAEKLVELKIVPSVSPMTVCNTLKKMNLNLTSADTRKYRRIKTPRS